MTNDELIKIAEENLAIAIENADISSRKIIALTAALIAIAKNLSSKDNSPRMP